MLDLTRTRIEHSYIRPAATVTAEGQALAISTTYGDGGVAVAASTAGLKFAGVSIDQQMTLTSLPYVELNTADATAYTFSLDLTPVSGSLFVYDVTSSAVLTAGVPATDAATYSISGTTITVNSARASHSIRVTYRYVPTTIQARMLQGDIPPGGNAGATLGAIGVITSGDVYTTEYDTTVDWTASNISVTLGDNGRFTIGGTGTVIDAVILNAPSTTDAFLGLHISV